MQVKGTAATGVEKKSNAQAAANKYNADGQKRTVDTKEKMDAVRSNNQSSGVGRAPSFNEFVASNNPVRTPDSKGMPTNLKSPVGFFATNEEVQTGKYLNEATAFDNIVSYLQSGKTDYDTTKSYLAQVDEQIGKFQPIMAKNSLALGWRSLRTALMEQANADNRAIYESLSEEVAKAQKDYDTQFQNYENAMRSSGHGSMFELEENNSDEGLIELEEILKTAKANLAAWQPNTNDERDALIAKMHSNAGVLKGGLTAEEQQRLLELDFLLNNPDIDYGKDFVRRGALVKGMAEKGAGHVNKAITGAANWLFGGLLDEFTALANTTLGDVGVKKELPNVVSSLDKWVNDVVAADEKYFGTNVEGSSIAQTVDKYGTMTAEAIPMAVIAHLTAGSSLTADGLAALSSLEQASGLSRIAQITTEALRAKAADPNFQFTFIQTFGQGYEQAIADGADVEEASVFALLNAFTNTSIEIEGGIQGLPDALKDGNEKALKAYAKSIIEEVGEEWRQNPAEQALKGVYKPVEFYSTDNEDAIFNPNRAVEEAKGAAVVSALLGAGPTAVQATAEAKAPNGAVTVDKNGRIVPVNAAPNAIRDMIIQNAHNEGVGLEEDISLDNNAPGPETEEAPVPTKEITPEEANNVKPEEQPPAPTDEEAPEEREEQTGSEEDLNAIEAQDEAENEELNAQSIFSSEPEARRTSGEERAEKQAPSELKETTEEQERKESGEERAEENAPTGKKEAPPERNETGEMRAEEQAPVGVKAEPQTEEQARNETGEQRAEQQAPEGKKTAEAPTASETATEEQAKATATQTQQEAQKSVKPAEESAEQTAGQNASEKAQTTGPQITNNNQKTNKKNGATAAEYIRNNKTNLRITQKVDAEVINSIADFLESGQTLSWTSDDPNIGYGKGTQFELAGNHLYMTDPRYNNRTMAYRLDTLDAIKNAFRHIQKSVKSGQIQLPSNQQSDTITFDEYGTSVIDTDEFTPSNVTQYVQKASPNSIIVAEVGNNVYEYDGKTLSVYDSSEGTLRSKKAVSNDEISKKIWSWANYGSPYMYYSKESVYNKEGESNGVSGNSRRDVQSSLLIGEQTGRSNQQAELDAAKPDFNFGENGEKRNDQEIARIEKAKADWEANVKQLVFDNGYTVEPISKHNKMVQKMSALSEKFGFGPVTIVNCKGKASNRRGFTDSNNKDVGVFLFTNYDGYSSDSLPHIFVHELMHQAFKGHDSFNRVELVTEAARQIGIPDEIIDRIFTIYKAQYAKSYVPDALPSNWNRVSFETKVNWINNNNLSAADDRLLTSLVGEEIISDIIGKTSNGEKIKSYGFDVDTISPIISEALQDGGVVSADMLSDFDDLFVKEESRPSPSTKKAKQQQHLKQQTQTKGARNNAERRAKDIAEKFNIGDGTYQSATREEVSRIADYCIEKYGLEEELDRLVNSKSWNRVDFSEAGKIAYDLTNTLERDMTKGKHGLGRILKKEVGETWEEYNKRQDEENKRAYLERREPIDALLQAYADQKTEAAQKLQEKYKFSIADELRMKVSQRFLSYTIDGEVHNANERQKNAKMWRIMDDLLTRAEKLEDSQNIKGMVDLTKMVGRIRGRENLLGKRGVKAENFMYARMIKNGLDADAMTALMYGNINKIMDDLTPMSYAEAIQSVRMTNMLSNIATGINNLLNNAVSLRTNSIAQNASMPFAKQFEKLTGKKVAVGDTSLLRTQPVRRAEELAYEYAVLSSYYGINEDNGRIDIKSGTSGFNPNGNWFERALARYNFFVNAFVLSPDAPAKARAEFGIKQGIEERFKDADMSNPENIRNKKELEGYAHKEAQRRTLQDDNAFTNAVLYIRDHFLGKAKTPGENKMIRGRRLGSFKLGEFMLAFAKVPTNVGIQKVAATPFGALYHTARYAYGLAKAKANPESMTVNEMAKISRDIGRAATTTGMIALGAMAAMSGALKNFDDTDDDDEKRLAKEKGYSGLTFNLSALFHGGEWRDGDTVISGNFLEILATPLTIGAIMWDAYKEGMGLPKAVGYGTLESFTGMVDAVMDIPGLQQVGELYSSFANQNPNDKTFKRTLKAIGQFAVSSSTSYFMPNIVSQANAGFDNRQRDVYTTNSYGETLRNIVMNKIPGLRQKLPEKTDTFGNSRTYADSRLMSVINTVLLPGDIKKYHVSEMEQELLRLNKEGYKSKWFDITGPKTIEVGDNEYALDADERRAYHMTKAQYLVEAYDAFRTSDVYKTLSDEERSSVYKSLKLDAERMTKNDCLETAGLPDRAKMDKWESLTGWDNKISYLVGKQLGSELWDDDAGKLTSFTETDTYMKDVYGKLPKDQRDLIDNSLSHFDDIYDASKHGINSKMWQEAYDIYKQYNSDEGKAAVEGGYKGWEATQMWTDIANKTGANEGQMKWFEENMKLYNHIAADSEKYHVLVDSGWDRNTAQSLMTIIADLQPANGNSTVSYKQRLTAIAKVNASEAEKWDAFYEYCPSSYTTVIRSMTQKRNIGRTYEKALKETKKWMD